MEIEINNDLYQNAAKGNDRTEEGYDNLKKEITGDKLALMHYCLGMSGECGEIVDIIKKYVMYEKKLEVEKIAEECGDFLWYMANLLTLIGYSFDDVMKINVNKLNKRYPNGFTKKDAIERKDLTNS